jgi:hypothetical protein
LTSLGVFFLCGSASWLMRWPFSVMGFVEIGSFKHLPGLASCHNPPHLCLLTSLDYRHEPLAPGKDCGLRPACAKRVSLTLSQKTSQHVPIIPLQRHRMWRISIQGN